MRRGHWGAVPVMTCLLYTLVFVPAAVALRQGDGAAEGGLRFFGRGRLATLGGSPSRSPGPRRPDSACPPSCW
ncbi:hypothetical protein FHR36_007776 [Kitasatospora paracochleata]|uniref:Uncharacterized protein n=1 Tax=Kitasatospora paracochleata TaxID=58354 RepID=A0ABT1JAV5_9ACTN|nr:hypothetical protein [Kitasatospora paracochleata]